MDSRGGVKPFGSGANTSLSSKGKNAVESSGPAVEQLSQGVADMGLDSAQDDGEWEVISKTSKNRSGSSSVKPGGSQDTNTKASRNPDAIQKLGMRNSGGSGRAPGNARPRTFNRGMHSNYGTPQPVIRPPLEHGLNWQARAGSTPLRGTEDLETEENDEVEKESDEDEDDDALDDTDDELLSEDFDSYTSQQSFETRKKSRWFKKFFDSLSVEDINEPARQWHCPACQGGPGAINWYRGLEPLITHAKTKGANRVKLHRELAELLDEELSRRGSSVVPAGEVFGKWKGLKDEEKDHEIVWPPMVIVMNTRLEQDDNDKWLGMGNQELLNYFSGYAAVKARHSYGPQSHRGMSVLIFESSARGHLEAERLHKHFAEQGTDRNAWDRRQVLFYHGGKRQLYGYMALKEDLDLFNRHSHGKSKLKYEMRSYHEMVVNQIRQMTEDNQQLIYLENKVVKEQRHSKQLEEMSRILNEKVRKTEEENYIVRRRTQMHHEQNMEELDFQEQFFKEQLETIHEQRGVKEEDFEKLQQDKRQLVKELNANPCNTEDYRSRVEEVEKFIELQDTEMGEYVGERDGLIEEHAEKLSAMKRRQHEEEVEIEREFDARLASLMKKYTPNQSQGTSNA
ncbi:PROTEIN SUPPRESSOR OF GENE SILENCING 3 [Salix koriyanagi]|uniref:PROTEIN SUPPRESSOR OF GENE SILENCING 3 n=1 Tax=Salix koriyanagi TaxID=2511006 RepID=A0A9Q0UYX4_9ROSI|nr:PROTEIN SUPPRESSOR OF GENE SILENCING 3 [Salix koriyanagi]